MLARKTKQLATDATTQRVDSSSLAPGPDRRSHSKSHLNQQGRLREVNLGSTAIQGDGDVFQVLQVVLKTRRDVHIPVLGQVPGWVSGVREVTPR